MEKKDEILQEEEQKKKSEKASALDLSIGKCSNFSEGFPDVRILNT